VIVKAQVSLNDGGETVLIYNHDRSIMQQFPAEPGVLLAIGPKKRAFFHAKIEAGIVVLERDAPEQGW